MSSYFNNFFQQLGTGDQIHTWAHGDRLFYDNNFRLSPKYDFLFHVYFEYNTNNATRLPLMEQLEAGMLVKSATLPKFTIDAKTYNAYNRPNIVQSKIKYDPVTITFHDDSADVITDFWYDYFTYYYRDSDNNLPAYKQAHKYQDSQYNTWGYGLRPPVTPVNGALKSNAGPNSNTSVPNLLSAIHIFSLHQKKFTEYVLVNPFITSFRHGDLQNGESGTLQNDMTVIYETVLYRTGNVSRNTVTGFGDLHYDKSPSPLSPAGRPTNTLLGPGGILQSADEVVNDLSNGNYLSAAFKSFRAYESNKSISWGQMAQGDLQTLGFNILTSQNPMNRISVPTLGGYGSTVVGAQSSASQSAAFFTGGLTLLGGLLGGATSSGSGPSSPTGATDGAVSIAAQNTQVISQTLATTALAAPSGTGVATSNGSNVDAGGAALNTLNNIR